MFRRVITVVAGLASAAAVAVVPTGGLSADAATVWYVALGDSYSAASGVFPPDLTAPLECARSTRNYPHVIAARTGYAFTDVTCGAAQTKDFAGKQYLNTPPQLDAVGTDTNLITMTIGGNDSGVFINVITKCGAAGLSTLGKGNPCQTRYGSSFVETIRNVTYPSLVNALAAVHAKAPHARVAIMGYPWIMPATGGCYTKMPVATGDVPYIRNIQWNLNDAIRRAAAATGTTYVNLNVVSDGHDACKPYGVRWVEPALFGTNPVIVHPNALGESKMAAQMMAVLGIG
ncbi:SGNH/GDSL hydrolase family protein [Nocardioides jiangxiensis]|uniref:SGNH/GDSL hydrolase family protein n=1 Tax=Nocardioides jiangxiensis TaxID=3064524 RepID=A0ABT9AXD4_9ACTN|nr:SGNH/GDSL hydrolase family protein [Nocardioides sp. WY-20]MDO7867200.1 SGNH/GDSL hydrolase family protein [Nocardioides sp. WY-20]